MISTGGHLTILESVDSTNNYAMAMVRAGTAKHGDGFFAMEQVQGRGQRGKTWFTEPGTNIILTLVLQTQIPLSQQFSLSAAIALAVHDFYAHYAGDETSVKWPNDIYWRDRKAGGILIESIVVNRQSGDENRESIVDSESQHVNAELVEKGLTTDDSPLTTRFSVVGMGININQTSFPENLRNVVSLKQITGKNWDVVELAKELSSCVANRYQQLIAGNDLLAEYNERLFKKEQTVKFKKDNRVFEGLVKGVDANGQLIVTTSLDEYFSFGEIEWILL